jgi:hypothetical protein
MINEETMKMNYLHIFFFLIFNKNSRFTCDIVYFSSRFSFFLYSSYILLKKVCAPAGLVTWIYCERMSFKRIREVRFVYLLYTIGSIVCVLFDRSSVYVIKLIVVFIYIRWHTNELSSCATSFPLCKHYIRLAVDVKGTNNVINVSSDGSLSPSLCVAWRCREIW